MNINIIILCKFVNIEEILSCRENNKNLSKSLGKRIISGESGWTCTNYVCSISSASI